MEAPFFTRNHMEKRRGNGYKLFLGGCQLELKKRENFHYEDMRTQRHWNNLPRKVVDSPTLDTSRIQLESVLGNLVSSAFS